MPRKKSEKTLGLEFIKKILEKRIKTKLSWSNSEITEGLREILKKTKTYKTISNQNGSYLLVDWLNVKGRKSRCLYIISQSGSKIPLTKNKFIKCFAKKQAKINRSNVIELLRELIKPQITEFRTEFKKNIINLTVKNDLDKINKLLVCPITKKRLNNKNHVDHHPISFIELADNWLESINFNSYIELPVKKTRNGLIMDIKFSESWIKYHKEKAQLRITSATGNLQKNSEGYRSKFKT